MEDCRAGLVGRRRGARKIDLQEKHCLGDRCTYTNREESTVGKILIKETPTRLDNGHYTHKTKNENIVPECHFSSSSGHGRQMAAGEQTSHGALQVGCLLVDGKGIQRGVLVGVEEGGRYDGRRDISEGKGPSTSRVFNRYVTSCENSTKSFSFPPIGSSTAVK